jgi:hypothetical protein
MIVVNLTQDKVWVARRGPDFRQAPPKFDIAAMGRMVIPAPRNLRGLQEKSIRDARFRRMNTIRRAATGLIPFWPTRRSSFQPHRYRRSGCWQPSAFRSPPVTASAFNPKPWAG